MRKLGLLLSFFVTFYCTAQDKEFWFAAPDISDLTACGPFDAPLLVAISNATDEAGTVTITYYNGGTPIVENGTVPAGGLYTREITNAMKGRVENPRSLAGTVTKYGIHITSTVAVTAYYQNFSGGNITSGGCNPDLFALKGSSALGQEFYVPMMHDGYYHAGTGYPDAYDQIDIVATEDGTTVTVVPKQEIFIAPSGSSPAGTPITRTLNRGETLKIMEKTPMKANDGKSSLGGTKITSDKPVAVTTTEDLVGRDNGGTGWDLIGDQIVPVNSLGASYVVTKGFMSGSDRAYIFATEDGTTVTVNSGAITTSPVLNAGDGWVANLGNTGNPQVISITANKAIYCYQVSGLRTGGDELGSALIPSLYSIGQRRLSLYQATASDYCFMVFRVGTHANFTITSNGSTSPLAVIPIDIPGIPEWKTARVKLPNVSGRAITIQNPQSPFSLGYFGCGSGGASYGYLSAFGEFKFANDTIYKCPGSPVTLDGSYAKNYLWIYPDGTTQTTPSVTVTQPGRYKLEMNQDPRIIVDTCTVVDIHYNASVSHSPAGTVQAGVPVSLSVQVNRYPGLPLSYEWTFPSGSSPATSTAAGPSVSFYEPGSKTVSLKLSYAPTQGGAACDTTLTYTVMVQPNVIEDTQGKTASVNGTAGNGTAALPVDIYYTDNLTYTLSVKNESPVTASVSVYDTVPDHLEIKDISDGGVLTMGTPRIIKWENLPVATGGGLKTVSFAANPSAGSGAAGRVYVNRAQIRYDNGGRVVTTNRTYHRAKAFPVTFAQGTGGTIANGATQMVDYTAHPAAGVTATPNLGYSFTGWSHPAYQNRNGGTEIAASGIADYTLITVKGAMALTAAFKRDTYGITYSLAGGTAASPANPSTYHVDTAFTLRNPTRNGYTFTGWTGSNGTTPQLTVTVAAGTTTGALNYTANWNPVSYPVTYDHAGGTAPATANPATYTIESGEITLNSPTRNGYTFTGWTGSNGTTPQLMVKIQAGSTGSRNYTANWSAVSYPIAYNYADGTAPATANRSTYTIENTPFTISNQPTRTGYTFAGWTGSNGTTPQTEVTVTEGTYGPLSYTANWTQEQYLISYDYNGGVAPATANRSSYNYDDAAFTISNPPTRTGYTFKGWTGDNGTTPQLTVTIPHNSTGNKQFRANWEAIPYGITYVPNGGSTPSSPLTYRISDPAVTLPPSVRGGYTFTGWKITSADPGVSVPTGITIPTGTHGNLTCEAQWMKIPYTITYSYAGGTAPAAANPVAYDVETAAITLNDPGRAGYTFDRWTITSSALGVTVAAGKTIPSGTYGNLTCTAVWTAISYNITYDYEGGSASNPATYTVETSTFILNPPVKPGKTFVGWTGSNGTVKQMPVVIQKGSSGPRNYTAHWNYNFFDRYGMGDTLYYCSPEIKLESGNDGLGYLWLLPDGSSRTSASIMAPASGRYYLQTNYGTITLTDSIYVLYASDADVEIRRVSQTGPKIGRTQKFTVNRNPLLRNVTFQWTFQDGVPSTSTADTASVVFNTVGMTKITLQVTTVNGGQTCRTSYEMEMMVYEGSRGFFVDRDATGTRDGRSWKNAYLTVQEALREATEEDFIWVAEGTYRPDDNNSFLLTRDSIEIYGGFGGWEEYLYERDIKAHPTVLAGAGHTVVVNTNAGSASRWDGFIIEGGDASSGGGIRNSNSSLTIANTVVRGNRAEEGGGIHNLLSTPLLYNVEISGNRAEEGGGMYSRSADSRLVNVTVGGNQASGAGSALYSVQSDLSVNNTIIWGNRTADGGTGIYNDSSTPVYSYSFVEGSKAGGRWNGAYGTDGGYNLDGNPFFRKNGFDNTGRMQAGNYRLMQSSGALNKGSNRSVYDIFVRRDLELARPAYESPLESLAADLEGMRRIQTDRVDMGAYEYGEQDVTPGILRTVWLPSVEGLTTDPEPGEHTVDSHSDFVFTVTAMPGYSLDFLTVTTGIPARDEDGIRMVRNSDGSMTVILVQVWESLTVGIGNVSPVSNAPIAQSRIWAYNGSLYIDAVKKSLLQIYTLNGQLYRHEELGEGQTKLPLPQGFYIIVLDRKISKIMIE